MSAKKIIIDYEEYQKMEEELDNVKNELRKIKNCVKFIREEVAPGCIRKGIKIHEKMLKMNFMIDYVIVDEVVE